MQSVERRQQPRYDVALGAEIIWNNGAQRQRCTIRDMSLDGARIETPFFISVPKRVFLNENGTGSLFECEVKWQQGTKLGLYFLDVGGRMARRKLINGSERS